MTGPAKSGVLIYAKDLEGVSAFYEGVLEARVLHADNTHRVLQSADAQLIVHAIPAHIARDIAIAVPPAPREEQAIKPFFTVERLQEAEARAERLGGRLCGPVWPSPGMAVRNVCDPEGNLVHLRELQA